MILIKGVRLPKIYGIALFPFVLVRTKKPSKILLNHEKIHLRQQVELLVVFFYIWYIAEWLYHYMLCRNWWQAYHQISFEKEAYQNETNLHYLQQRSVWAFLKFIAVKKKMQ